MLEIKNIDVYYSMAKVLFDVSFDVQEGELVALVGANGAGKTTLLNTISGLIKPRRGSISFLGKTIHRLPAHKVVEEGLVLVPEGRHLFPEMTVRENLELGAFSKRARILKEGNREKVYQMFPVLAERGEQLAGTLSGGEQQMLAIGRALMSAPKILMLDEPSQGLAPLIVENLFKVVESICREQKITVFLVEQNVKRALSIADRALVLENGAIVLQGRGSDLLADEHLKKAYLGM